MALLTKFNTNSKKKEMLLIITTIIGLSLSFILTLLIFSGVFDKLENRLIDIGMRNREKIPIDERIITVDIDDPAINQIGRWPWSWYVHAAVYDFLTAHKAQALVFTDMDFSSKTPLSFSDDWIEKFKANLKKKQKQPGTDFLKSTLNSLNEKEALFAESLDRTNNAYFTIDMKFLEEAGKAEPEGNKNNQEKSALLNKATIYGEKVSIADAVYLKPLIKSVSKLAKGSGFNKIMLEKDGVLRKYPLMASFNGKIYSSLGLKVASHILDVKETKIGDGKIVYLKGREQSLKIPLTSNGEIYINWVGAYRQSFPHIPFRLIAGFAAIDVAKKELARYSLAMFENPMDLRELIIDKLSDSGLLSFEECESTGTILFVAYLLEHYLMNSDYELHEIMSAIGLDPENELWKKIAVQILFANVTAKKARKSGEVPDFEELFNDKKIMAVQKPLPSSDSLRTVYDLVTFYFNNEIIDRFRPLYFGEPKTVVADNKELVVTQLYFKDKIIFYGLTATGLTAHHPTPFMRRHPTLDMAPNILNSFLTENFLYQLPDFSKYLFCYLYIFLVLISVFFFTPLAGTMMIIALISGHIVVSWYCLITKGYMFPVSQPLTAAVFSYFTALIYGYFQEMKARKKVRNMFSTMVSPEVLKIMENQRGKLKLTGEKKEATMFSSDVSGFTTISEGVTSSELANILNIYLTAMSNIIMTYDGYVDKYEGDAIKAAFGVPLHDPDHAWKACFAALYQQKELKVVQRMILLKYGVEITARMGVHTGTVAVGNMGSEKRLQYSVIGEAAEISEELEVANKQFGTYMSVSGAVYERVKDYIEVRYLDNLPLGHSHNPISIYELKGWNREKYLEYWQNRPIPDLLIEMIKEMPPEKVLAYHDFYHKERLSESQLSEDLKSLFTDLAKPAVEYMKLNNLLTCNFIKTTLEELSLQFSADKTGSPEPGYILNSDSSQSQAQAVEEWSSILQEWRLKAGEISQKHKVFKKGQERETYSKYLNIIDMVEKNIESLHKRVTFPNAGDHIAIELSNHLKKLLPNDKEFSESLDVEKVSEQINLIKIEINRRLTHFAEELKKRRAKEYHNFMSELCVAEE